MNIKIKNGTGFYLTQREEQVLRFICKGLTNVEIAEKLFISSKTVEGYKTKLISKTKAKNTANLVLKAAMYKLIEY